MKSLNERLVNRALLMAQGVDVKRVKHLSFLATDLDGVGHALRREIEYDEFHNPPLKRTNRKRVG